MAECLHGIPITAIIENEGQFLFVRRARRLKNMAGKWVFPGGLVEKGEDAIQALFRELAEETGLQFTDDVAFLSAYQFIRTDGGSAQGLVFLVRSKNRDVKVNSEVEEYLWINPENIADFEFCYKPVTDFDKQTRVTIPGMEVHVRNAIIVLKKGMMLNRNLLSVTEYQNSKGTMTKEYLQGLKDCE